MKPRTRIITGCNDCPFYKTLRSGAPRCDLYAGADIYLSDKLRPMHLGGCVPITPKNCPLKTQAVIITYET